jgi:hypothetical protein
MNREYSHDPRQPWTAEFRTASLADFRSKAAQLPVDQLRPYGYDYCYLNLLSIFGDAHTTDEIHSIAGECMRNHLLFGEEFHAYCLAARGQRSWDEEMRDFDFGISLTAQARSTLKELINKRSVLACAFHWSGFRFIPFGLSSLGVPVRSLLGEAGSRRYGPYFVFNDTDLKDMRARGVAERFSRVGTVGTNNQQDLLRTLRLLRTTRAALFIPVDGMFTSKPSRSSVDISFSGVPLKVRSNPARLAAMLGMPLVSLFAYRQDSGAMPIEIADVIEPKPGRDFEQEAMHRLYGSLERHAKSVPTHWEGARTFHHWRTTAAQEEMPLPTIEEISAVRSSMESGMLSLDPSRVARVQLPGAEAVWVDSHTLRCLGRSRKAQKILEALGNPADLKQVSAEFAEDEQQFHSLLRFVANLRSQGLLRNVSA